MTLRKVRLQEIANARSGDKGNRLNIALVGRDPTHYPAVAENYTRVWFRKFRFMMDRGDYRRCA